MVLLESLAEDYVSSLREGGLREGEAWRDQPRCSEALAIARLGLLAERILAAGYSRQVDEERRMWTSRLSGSDQDLQRTSVLLTKVFEPSVTSFPANYMRSSATFWSA
jgi:hypothetical protein